MLALCMDISLMARRPTSSPSLILPNLPKRYSKVLAITISTEGKSYLGGAIGSTSFTREFVGRKVQDWVDEIKTLSNDGLSKWNYVLRVSDLEAHSTSEPLEVSISSLFIPAITG